MTTKLKPLSNRVVVKPDDQQTMTRGGIHVPPMSKYIPQFGTVIAVGPGYMAEVPYFVRLADPDLRGIPWTEEEITKPEFARMPMNVEVGDRVFFAKNSGVHIQIEREEFIVVRLTDLLAFVEGEGDE